MAAGQYILVNEEILEKILKEIKELRELLLSGCLIKQSEDDVKMDTADLVQDLKMDRKTIYNYRKKKNMPSHRKDNGRIFYWKSEIDAYFGKK